MKIEGITCDLLIIFSVEIHIHTNSWTFGTTHQYMYTWKYNIRKNNLFFSLKYVKSLLLFHYFSVICCVDLLNVMGDYRLGVQYPSDTLPIRIRAISPLISYPKTITSKSCCFCPFTFLVSLALLALSTFLDNSEWFSIKRKPVRPIRGPREVGKFPTLSVLIQNLLKFHKKRNSLAAFHFPMSRRNRPALLKVDRASTGSTLTIAFSTAPEPIPQRPSNPEQSDQNATIYMSCPAPRNLWHTILRSWVLLLLRKELKS